MSPTPLLAVLRAASREERDRLARLAGTTVAYLYQLATCKRPNISATLALALADATVTMSLATEGRLVALTVREIATMCPLQGLCQ